MRTLVGYLPIAAFALLAAGCGTAANDGPAGPAPASTQAVVVANGRTQPLAGETKSAVVALATTGNHVHIVAAARLHGVAVFGVDGKPTASIPHPAAERIAVSYGFPLDGKPTTLLATIGGTDNSVRVLTMHDGKPARTEAHSAPLDFATEGLCLFRNRIDGQLYVFIVGKGGEVDQQIVYADAKSKLALRDVRRISFPTELKSCVAADDGDVYVSEQSTGIWRFNGNPEADLDVTLVDAAHLGHITGETGGLALYDGGEGSQWLLAALPSAGRINVYDRDHGDAFVGSFRITDGAGGKTLAEPGELSATSMALGTDYPHGMLIVGADDDHDFRLVSMADVATALGMPPGTSQDPRHALKPLLPTVTALAETAPVQDPGDAADDPAIWANPDQPDQSLIVGTDKAAGMYLYDMQGKVLQFRADGRMNNTDLRDGFELGGHKAVLVTASDRTHDSIAIYRLDTRARKLVNVADGVQSAHLGEPYGSCMYRNPANGKTYVYINTKEGLMRQWQLIATDGRVRAKKVRDFKFGSQVEGCAADDPTGQLFVDEEDVALWALSAKPDDSDTMHAIDRIADNPALTADLEGLGVYDLGNGRGYIVISVQGNNTYAVYRLEGKHEYLGSFAVVANPVRGIDGISQTDGLDITSRSLGPGFEHGAMIAQDGRNVMPAEHQNYKYVSWDAIAKALHLEVRKTKP